MLGMEIITKIIAVLIYGLQLGNNALYFHMLEVWLVELQH